MTDVTTTRLNRPGSLWRRIWNCRVLYLLILPLIVWYVMFCYVPMAGLYLAFERFSYKGGIWGSAWVGLNNFREFLTDGEFLRSLRNTVIFSLGKLALQFPMAIMLALALNELQHARIKKIYQTVFTFPHFISWVVMAGILKNMFASNGVINQLLTVWGMESVSPLLSLTGFRPFIWFSNIWKEAGWDTIIYMAALAGILFCSRIGFVTSLSGNGYEMKAVAACVLGGISLSGGVGSVVGAAIGAVIMSSISYLLVFMGFSSNYDNTITGIILITIVVADALMQRRAAVRNRHERLAARTTGAAEGGEAK